jgi:predicted component of type VI protein secretion system
MTLFWLALLVAIALIVASLFYVTRQGLAAFRAFKRLGRVAGEDLARIEQASAQIERHLALAAEGGTQLEASLARLQQSRAQLTVLTTALADARASLGRVTGVFPRK